MWRGLKFPLLSIALALVVSQAVCAQTPNVGDHAPDFELKGSDGIVYKLSDLKGIKAVVVAWFPKAFTSG